MTEINYEREVADFLASHPRYRPTSANQGLLTEFLEDFSLPFDAHHLDLAFLNLVAQDKLELEPEEEPAPAPAPRRRTFTAFRNGRPIGGEATRL